VRTGQIEDWRLDTEAASPGCHVAEYVLAFGRRTTLMSRNADAFKGDPACVNRVMQNSTIRLSEPR